MNPSNPAKWAKARATRGERRKRTVYTKEQVALLTEAFEAHPYPGYEARERLAREIGIPEARIHVWFQNRRARQLPKPLNHGKSSGQENLSVPGPATDGLDYSPITSGPVWGDLNPLGENWTLLGHPETFQLPGGSQEAAPSTSEASLSFCSALPVPQSSDDWESSAPTGSGLVPTVPWPSQQPHLLHTHPQTSSYDPYHQHQIPQLGGHFYSAPPCSSPNSALGLQGASDLAGPFSQAPGAADHRQVSQPGFYGNEEPSCKNWG